MDRFFTKTVYNNGDIITEVILDIYAKYNDKYQNILFIRTDELWSNPQQTIEKITHFLGVKLLEVVRSAYIAPIINKLNEIPSECVQFILNKKLTDFYASDIKKTENLTGIHLADWLDTRYSETIK
mgnify:CR=1 FL=1